MRLKKDGRVRDFVSEGGMGWGGVLKLACVCGLSLRSVPSVSSIPLIRNNHFGLCYEVKSEFFIGLVFFKKKWNFVQDGVESFSPILSAVL